MIDGVDTDDIERAQGLLLMYRETQEQLALHGETPFTLKLWSEMAGRLCRVFEVDAPWSPKFNLVLEELHRAAYDPATAPTQLVIEHADPTKH